MGCQLTAKEAEAGLVAADVLAVHWWLEERLQYFDLMEAQQESCVSPYIVLTFFACSRGNVKVSGLEGQACWPSTTRKEVGCPLVCCCCPLVATWLS